jgi:very-short-patch-repair endonuclease
MSRDYNLEPLRWIETYIDHVFSRVGLPCESPIEEGLIRALIALRLVDRRIRLRDFPGGEILTDSEAVVHAQYQVGEYRLDFAIEVRPPVGPPSWIGVECDGHEFHERTKEQAARDKSRDRSLTAQGFRMLRFTGSEIHRDNMACALQIHALILSICEGDIL